MLMAFAAVSLLGLGLGAVGAMRLAGKSERGPAVAATADATPPSYYKSRPNTPPGHRWGPGYIPNYRVVDQDGNAFNFYDDLVAGKKVIINFIYTSCSEICPLTTSRMAMLQDRLGDALGRDYFIYSITIDPERDGQKELKTYASAFNVKPGWRFLTGAPDEIAEISYKLGERAKNFTDHRQDILLGNGPAEKLGARQCARRSRSPRAHDQGDGSCRSISPRLQAKASASTARARSISHPAKLSSAACAPPVTPSARVCEPALISRTFLHAATKPG